MKKTIEYRQCTLRKARTASVSTLTVGYIPAKFARLNKRLRLKRDDGQWDDGWVVEQIGASIIESELPDAHRAIKDHRKSTGDVLPRGMRSVNVR